MYITTSNTDYLNEGVLLHLVINGVATYASINSIMRHKSQMLVPSGKYFVYMLHPMLGSVKFVMVFNTVLNKWMPTKEGMRIESDTLLKISDCIKLKLDCIDRLSMSTLTVTVGSNHVSTT